MTVLFLPNSNAATIWCGVENPSGTNVGSTSSVLNVGAGTTASSCSYPWTVDCDQIGWYKRWAYTNDATSWVLSSTTAQSSHTHWNNAYSNRQDSANIYQCTCIYVGHTCTANSDCCSGLFCNSGSTCQSLLSDGGACVGATKISSVAEQDGACSSGDCDNDGVGAADDGVCFTATDTYYDSEDNKCEYDAYPSMSIYADENRGECSAGNGFVGSGCSFRSDGDYNETVCTCLGDTYYTNIGTMTGSNSLCCGDDVATDDFTTYSNSLTTSESLSCRECTDGIDLGPLTLFGNGYWENYTCIYGDISCSSGSASNGTSGISFCQNDTSTCCTDSSTIAEGVGCSDGTMTGIEYERDSSEGRCTSVATSCTPYYWNIGGEINATVCCGDDVGENKIDSLFDTTMEGTTDGTDACCTASTDCIDNDICFDSGLKIYNADDDQDLDNDYCNSGIWYDCFDTGQCEEDNGYFCIDNDCINYGESVVISNLGTTGVDSTNGECTDLKSVVLNLIYSENATECRYSNEEKSNFSPWESCVNTKYWNLIDEQGIRTVFYQINHSDDDNIVTNSSDTIEFDYTGACLDLSEPLSSVITDEGLYLNNNSRLYGSWTPSYDPEAAHLGIQLVYEYKINGTNLTSIDELIDWTPSGTQREFLYENKTPRLREGMNYTIYLRVINSNNLTSNSISNGIIVDTIPPQISGITSTSHIGRTWYNNDTITLSWNFLDTNSGLYGYNHQLDIVGDHSISKIVKTTGSTESEIYYNVKNGNYTFFIRARDNAGNWADTEKLDYWIGIDTTPPTRPNLLMETKNADSENTVFNWAEAMDPDSGIVNYFLNVTDIDNGSTIFNGWINTTSPSYTIKTIMGRNYMARVLALNGADLNSSFIMMSDITPPIITFVKPEREIIRSPVLVAMTNEKATCFYKLPGRNYIKFIYTNTTLHETKITIPKGVYNDVEIMCSDVVNLRSSRTIDFDYDSYNGTFLTVSSPVNYYVYENVMLNFTVRSAAEDIGEIRRNDIILKIDNTIVDKEDYSLWDAANGSYQLLINGDRFVEIGNHDINITIDTGKFTLSDLSTISIGDLKQWVSIKNSFGIPMEKSHISYIDESFGTIGVASDSEGINIGSHLNDLNISARLDGKSYIFYTKDSNKIIQKNRKFENDDFVGIVSFGYNDLKDYYIRLSLEYETLEFNDQIKIQEGKPRLLLKNLGLNNLDYILMDITRK
ncbi:hypothetical protein HN827_02185 [archaeon]|nr:hypothetical protein [archaeon]